MTKEKTFDEKVEALKEKYYFCYSHKQYVFISVLKGVPYICEAFNPKSKCVFRLYERNEELALALQEYTDRVTKKLRY